MGLISFGKISKVHGLSGEVRVAPFSRQLDNISTLEKIFIVQTPDSSPVELTITKSRVHKNTAVFKIQGIDSIEDAEKLVGKVIHVEMSDLQELEDDEYYWFDLIGLKAYTEQGQYIGEVKDLIDRSLQSLLVVKNGDKEHLIPLTEPIVKQVDLEHSKIIINPISGLLD